MSPHGSRRKLVYLVVCALLLGWCALVVSPPWLHRAGHDDTAVMVRLALGTVCHQIPSRSFSIDGVPLGVCARCTGLYAGALAGGLLSLGLLFAGRSPRRYPPRGWLVGAAMPMILEWLLGHTGLTTGSTWGRAATGLLFGSVVAFYFLPAIDEMCGEIAASRRRRSASPGRNHAAST